MAARVFIGLGSNVGQPDHHIRTALMDLAVLPSTRLTGESSLYGSAPVGPPNQPDFINAVAELKTALTPLVLLRHLQRIERRHGRVRVQHWGRRTLDLDLLLYGGMTVDRPRLQVPHPRMHQRLFVLAPLHELDPGLTIPGRGSLVRLLDSLYSKDYSAIYRV
jgi:2-amino-4-hydroxy-6-hydroxymethyldihydropteridine diphosphokinase